MSMSPITEQEQRMNQFNITYRQNENIRALIPCLLPLGQLIPSPVDRFGALIPKFNNPKAP